MTEFPKKENYLPWGVGKRIYQKHKKHKDKWDEQEKKIAEVHERVKKIRKAKGCYDLKYIEGEKKKKKVGSYEKDNSTGGTLWNPRSDPEGDKRKGKRPIDPSWKAEKGDGMTDARDKVNELMKMQAGKANQRYPLGDHDSKEANPNWSSKKINARMKVHNRISSEQKKLGNIDRDKSKEKVIEAKPAKKGGDNMRISRAALNAKVAHDMGKDKMPGIVGPKNRGGKRTNSVHKEKNRMKELRHGEHMEELHALFKGVFEKASPSELAEKYHKDKIPKTGWEGKGNKPTAMKRVEGVKRRQRAMASLPERRRENKWQMEGKRSKSKLMKRPVARPKTSTANEAARSQTTATQTQTANQKRSRVKTVSPEIRDKRKEMHDRIARFKRNNPEFDKKSKSSSNAQDKKRVAVEKGHDIFKGVMERAKQ